MSSKPRIFISAVSSEFRQLRQLVAQVLLRMGYDPVWQDTLSTEAGDLRNVLRRKIDDCQGVLQIVGSAYGYEPEVADPEFGRVSYTQFELAYARKRGKKTWVVVASDGCTRDTSPDQLDLPPDPGHPDPAGYQTERRALQKAWVEQLTQSGHLHHPATSDTELELRVERLKDDMAELRRTERLWRRTIIAALVAICVLAGAAVILISNMEPSGEASGVDFTELGGDDIRPEVKRFGSGFGWNISLQFSPKATKFLGFGTGVKCLYSTDGSQYHEALNVGWIMLDQGGEPSGQLFLKFHSFDGEEIGPFEYELDYGATAKQELKKLLEKRTHVWASINPTGLRLSEVVLNSLDAIKKIEVSFDGSFDAPHAIEVPEVEVNANFGGQARSLLGADKSYVDVPVDAEMVYCRFTYRDGTVGKTFSDRIVPGTAAWERFDEERANTKLRAAGLLKSLGREHLTPRIVGYRNQIGWTVTLNPRLHHEHLKAFYSVDGSYFAALYSHSSRIDDLRVANDNQVQIKVTFGEEQTVGPFTFEADFLGMALKSIKEWIDSKIAAKGMRVFHVSNGRIQISPYFWSIEYLPAVDRIEYGFTPELDEVSALEMPRLKFSEYRNLASFAFGRAGDGSKTDIRNFVIQPEEGADVLYFRLVYYDGTRSEVVRLSTASAPSSPPSGIQIQPPSGGGGGGAGFSIPSPAVPSPPNPSPPVAPPPPDGRPAIGTHLAPSGSSD